MMTAGLSTNSSPSISSNWYIGGRGGRGGGKGRKKEREERTDVMERQEEGREKRGKGRCVHCGLKHFHSLFIYKQHT